MKLHSLIVVLTVKSITYEYSMNVFRGMDSGEEFVLGTKQQTLKS